MRTVAIYDPTSSDKLSKVRGIGRCLQTFHEVFSNTDSATNDTTISAFANAPTNQRDNMYFNYLTDLRSLRSEMLFVNPFFNPVQSPLKLRGKLPHTIALIHDLIPLKYPKAFPTGLRGKWYHFLNKRAIKKYSHIVTVSQTTRNDVMKLYQLPESKISVIYPTVPRIFLPHLDTSEESVAHHHPFHKQNESSIPEFTRLSLKQLSTNKQLHELKDFAIYVGDATWNKNLPNLARAIKMTNIPCVFVGKIFGDTQTNDLSVKPHPWQKSLYEFLQIAQNDPRFIFPGYVSDIELRVLYEHAKLNVLVSYDEGFGYSFIEAGYQSTPSVLADTAIFHEIAGDAADYANPQDPKDIAQKMSELFYDQIHHEKMSIKSFDRAQRYNQNTYEKSWLNLFTSIQ